MSTLAGPLDELSAAPVPKAARLHYVQALRILLMVLVVAHHAAEPYVIVGGEWDMIVKDPARSDTLLFLFVLNRTFFMGFFFLIAGYFLEASYQRRGAMRFVLSRLKRLGIPLLFFVVLLNGGVGYAIYGGGKSFTGFLVNDYLLGGNAEFGPLWFIAHLLIYVLIFAVLRSVVPAAASEGAAPEPPGHIAIAIYLAITGIVTAGVRYFYPIDDWIRLFGLVPAEPARLPLYVSLFVIGIIAGRGNWFECLSTRVALIWFAIGAGLFAVLSSVGLPRLGQPDTTAFRLFWGFLEPVVGVGLIVGLVVIFRALLSRASPTVNRLAANAYGVFLVHIYFVIGAQAALQSLAWPALAKFAVVLATGLAVSLALVALLRRVPAIRAVI